VGKARPHQRSLSVTTDVGTPVTPTQPRAMGIEDQREEREVLESIFPEEITGNTSLHDTASRTS
jgi:hypothetical protein